MNDSLFQKGDIVVTDLGFFVFRELAADGYTYESSRVPNPLRKPDWSREITEFRVAIAAAVAEASTWAMMILGFVVIAGRHDQLSESLYPCLRPT